MRARVVLTVVILAVVFGSILYVFRRQGVSETAKENPPAPVAVSADNSSNENAAAISSLAPTTSSAGLELRQGIGSAAVSTQDLAKGVTGRTQTPKAQIQEAKHQEAVEARTSELMDLAMNDDTNSLHTILSELNNPDAEIRKAALEAAVQFGASNAIPALESAAQWNDNPEEKKEIADAIEFLKLPRLGDPNFPISTSGAHIKKPNEIRRPVATRK